MSDALSHMTDTNMLNPSFPASSFWLCPLKISHRLHYSEFCLFDEIFSVYEQLVSESPFEGHWIENFDIVVVILSIIAYFTVKLAVCDFD